MFNRITFEKFLLYVSIASFTSVFIAIVIFLANIRTQKELDEAFYNRCAAACAPNSVYSTDYRRCMCNVQVIVKDIK